MAITTIVVRTSCAGALLGIVTDCLNAFPPRNLRLARFTGKSKSCWDVVVQPSAVDTAKPQLSEVAEERPKLGPVYHSPITMIGWCILLLNFAGVVPAMIVSAYITYGFFAKRDLASVVA